MNTPVVAVLLVTACSGSHDPGAGNVLGGHDAGVGGGTATFKLSGMLSDSLGNVSNQRAVVGVAQESDVTSGVDCSKLIVKWDSTVAALPATYSLAGIPEGTFFLVALLPTPGSSQAPVALLEISVNAAGIHYNSHNSTSVVDIAIQGMTTYACQ